MESQNQDFVKELYKYWFSYNGKGGFLSVSPWFDAQKIAIDIGALSESNGKTKLESNTQVWCNMLDLHTYLASIRNGSGPVLFPAQPKGGLGMDSPECFIYYGGGNNKDGQVVSRILKIHYWQLANGSTDTTAFAWKTACFEGKRNDSGAIMPDMKNVISQNMIKIPRLEMAKMANRIEFSIQAYATASAIAGKNWWEVKDRS